MAALEIDVVQKPPLSSLWDGLSPYLIARFYPVERRSPTDNSSAAWLPADGGVTVAAPLVEANLDATLNWQSPFEQSGPESSMPSIMAMLQSGAIQQVVDSADRLADASGLSSVTDGAIEKSRRLASSLEGRTGITRLNSTQVFSGMPPIKITVTALFRAWRDAGAEVEDPVNQLMLWALPTKLSDLGPILSRAVDYAVGDELPAVDVLAPSVAPTKIGMTYKGRRYAPLVIESIGLPISSPVTSDGKFTELQVPMTLCSLSALDRDDWQTVIRG